MKLRSHQTNYDNLKAALLTHSDLTGAQIDELINEAHAQADF